MNIPLFEEEEPEVSSFVLPLDCLIPPHSQTSPSVVVPGLSDDVPGPSRLSTPLQPSFTGKRPTDHKTAQQPSTDSEAPFRNPHGIDVEHTSVQTVFCEWWFELLPLNMHI